MEKLVIVPTYNERENIEVVITRLLALPYDLHVLVVDDASPDGTGDLVEAWSGRDPRVHVLRRPGKMGLGSAYRDGFRYALAGGAEYVFEMDADLSHDPREVPKFLTALETYDMVIGSRYIEGGGSSEWGVARPILSWLANKYIALVAGVPVRDTTSGYRGYRRAVLEETEFDRIKISGYVVHGEMAYQAWIHGFRLGEVPIHFRNRRREASKLTFEEIYTALANFALLRFRYGFRPRPRAGRPAAR